MAKILTDQQELLLELLFSDNTIQKNFYLTGGTTLAQYYLHHRYSEDLDFFSQKEVDPLGIQVVLKRISKKARITKIDFQQSFNRNLFYLYFDNEVLKTEFTYFPFLQIEASRKIGIIRIDSLLDIAVNKTFTLYQNPRSRDFIDLFLILKEKGWTFEDLKKKARIKFDTSIDPLQMAQQLLQAPDLKDYPRMVIPLKAAVWQDFWRQEAAKLKSKAFS